MRLLHFNAILALLALTAMPTVAYAQSTGTGTQERANMSVAELERDFWICDYAATTGPIDQSMAAPCSVVFEVLKARKFDGDFTAMLVWWRQHKAARHLALETASQQAARRTATVNPQ